MSKSKEFPDHDSNQGEEALPTPKSSEATNGGGVSLRGEQGREVARNLLRLSAGMVTPEELGGNYYRTADGSLGLVVDEETAETFRRQRSE